MGSQAPQNTPPLGSVLQHYTLVHTGSHTRFLNTLVKVVVIVLDIIPFNKSEEEVLKLVLWRLNK